MREGILEQLPKTLPKDKLVFVFGHDDMPGGKTLKSMIDEFNSKEEWIRAEFKPTQAKNTVSEKAAVVLTMYGIGHGPLMRIRNAAAGICCPNQALTVSEAKEVLRFLKQVRDQDAPVVGVKEFPNGNKIRSVELKQEPQKSDGIVDSKESSESLSPETIPQEKQNRSDFDLAMKTINQFGEKIRSVIEEVQLAIMIVGDEIDKVGKENNNFRLQVQEKERELSDLREDLVKANDKVTRKDVALHRKVTELEEKNSQLQGTLDRLSELLKGVRK